MTKRDMRTRSNKQHLGTAANRNEYEQKGNVVVQDSKVKQDGQQEQQKGETK
jgi:hypothetical protein